jgi:hypothetical protein
MKNQRVGRASPSRFRHRGAQLLLDDGRVVAFRNPDPVRDAQHMSIDGEAGHTERVAEHHICRLSADTGQLDESVHVGRHLATMIGH